MCYSIKSIVNILNSLTTQRSVQDKAHSRHFLKPTGLNRPNLSVHSLPNPINLHLNHFQVLWKYFNKQEGKQTSYFHVFYIPTFCHLLQLSGQTVTYYDHQLKSFMPIWPSV